MILWVLATIAVGLLLSVSIEKIITRLGVKKHDETPGGLAVVAERLERWSEKRMNK